MPEPASLADVGAPVAVAFIAGMCVPFEDGMRSLRGFGRWAFDKLPQQPREGSQ